jgi:hypothetical protein
MIKTISDDFNRSVFLFNHKDLVLLFVLLVVLPLIFSSVLPALNIIAVLGHLFLFPLLLSKIFSNSSSKVTIAPFTLISLSKYCLFVVVATLLEAVGFVLLVVPGVFIGKNFLMVSVLSLLPEASMPRVFLESSSLMHDVGWSTYWTVFVYSLVGSILSGWRSLYALWISIFPYSSPFDVYGSWFIVDIVLQIASVAFTFFMIGSRIANSYLMAIRD